MSLTLTSLSLYLPATCVYEGVHRLLQRVFILSAERDYVMECAGYCRMYLFAHSRATHGVILVGCRRVC